MVGIYVLVSSTSSFNIHTLSPYCLDILELFQVFGCKCSFCFSPGLCRIAFPTFRTVSDVHLFTHSPQVWLRDHFQWFLLQKPFLDLSSLVWVLLPCAPIPQLTSVSLWWPVDVCVCVCVTCSFYGKVLTSTRWESPSLRWPPWSLLLATAPWSGGVYSFPHPGSRLVLMTHLDQ